MAIIVQGSEYDPAPEGLHAAVCVDVIDKGIVDTPWGPKHKIRVVWEVEATMEDGKRFCVGKTYAASLHEKSTLHKDLKDWRGKPFTGQELRGFDLEKLIGASCQLLVKHNEKDGSVYSNVAAILKAVKKLPPSGQYKRVKDRSPQQQTPPQRNGQQPLRADNNNADDVQEDPFAGEASGDLGYESIPF